MDSPPRSPSKSKEGMALRKDFSLDKLEAQEQSIIQHVRTAGLRKPRETALIDELLEMRRERRQIFSALVAHTIQLHCSRQQLSEELDRAGSLLRETKSAQQLEIKRLEEAHTHELEHHAQRLKRKYEDKLRLIGDKVEQVASAKRHDEQQAAESLARDMTAAAMATAEKKYDERLGKYKEALRTLVERERDLEAAAQRQGGLARSHQREAQDLKAQLEQQLATSSQDRATLRSAQTALQAEQTQQAALRLELGRARDQAQAEVRALREAHADELQVVEDKVKDALGRRDDLIASLREALARTARAKDAAEHVLSDLKSSLSA